MTDLSGELKGSVLFELHSPGEAFCGLSPPGAVSPVKPTAGLMVEKKKMCQYCKRDAVVHGLVCNVVMDLTISVSS